MSSALSFMKYIIFTFNFILWCFGAALFGLGIWIRTDEDFWEYENNLPVQNYYQATYIVITVGAILLIIGFIGCCGAATDSLCLLLTLKCCGATSMLDYRNKGWTIPQSCSDDRSNNVFIRGCGENLRRYLASKGGILGGMAIGLTLIQRRSSFHIASWHLVFPRRSHHLQTTHCPLDPMEDHRSPHSFHERGN
ncbi:uncharacterized protein LOC143253030 isoform X3 [Tachypleus tridentatus]|uniref:uncharacterized protein LOC143253030 isoform X3 n=1 Tax=Tachypleus tridentatus TaxID=6853 RepID=UPI003FD1BE1C